MPDKLDSMMHTAVLIRRLEALEADAEIRRVLARYMEICDHLGPDTSMEELGALFTRDAVWEGGGARYGTDFGGYRGRAGIVAFLERYRSPRPHFSANAHFLTTGNIVVTDQTAEGKWMMLQTPTFATGESFLLGARLEIAFRCEDAQWRIARLKTTSLFARPIEGGWDSKSSIPQPPGDMPKRQEAAR